MPLIQIIEPTSEPVSLQDVKDAAKIDDASFDGSIAIIIPALRRQAESRTGRRLITQTVELVLDAFPPVDIDLQLPNVQSVASVKYLDTAGVEQTLASNLYSLDSSSTPNWLLPAYGTTWPATLDAANAVRVRFVVGYGDTAAAVPQDIRLWIIAHAVQALRAPEGITIGDLRALPYVDHLLDSYIVWKGNVIEAGKLDQRVKLQQKSVTRNAIGEDIVTWTDVVTNTADHCVWAEARPLRGQDYLAAQQIQQRIEIRFFIRTRVVGEDWRVMWKDVPYDITGIIPGTGPYRGLVEIDAVHGERAR